MENKVGEKMIESLQNGKVKNWLKLKKKKDRMKANSFLIEGEHLVEEALQSGWKLKHIILREGYSFTKMREDIPTTTVSEKVFQALSFTEHPQGIMAEMEMQEGKYDPNYRRILLLDRIQDPGNVGTMIRSADAFQFDAVILGEGTVDLYNDKVIRASQGSLFHLPVLSGALNKWVEQLKKDNFTIWATALKNARSLPDVEKPEKVCVIFGNEGSGVHESLLQSADERIFIPITGKAESLNVSIASSIIMYDLRQ